MMSDRQLIIQGSEGTEEGEILVNHVVLVAEKVARQVRG
jgi:hypothetical protein